MSENTNTTMNISPRTYGVLLARSLLASRAGLQFGGKRDLYNALGYLRRLTWSDFRDRYKRNGIASRIVDAPVRATWKNFPDVCDVNNPDKKSRFEKAWINLATKLKLSQKFQQVDRLAGLDEYAILFIGAGTNFTTELRSISADKINYISVFNANAARIKDYVDDPRDSRYGLPLTYEVDFKNKSGVKGTSNVHWSRLIHVAENTLEDDLIGNPMIERVWNYLDDLDKIVGGTGEAIWRVIDRGIQFDVDKEAELENPEELKEQIEAYMHGFQRYIRTQGIQTTQLGADAPDPSGGFQAIVAVISGTTCIPQRILTGSERGQLASTQDRSSWAERILERQKTYAEPVILRPFVDRMIEIGVLPTPKQDLYEVCWSDLLKMTELEKATVARHIAIGVQKISEQYTNSNAVVVTVPEFREMVGLNPIISNEDDVLIAKPKEGDEVEQDPEKEDDEEDDGEDSEDIEEEDSQEETDDA